MNSRFGKPHPKCKFTRDEDEELRRIVAELGTSNWSAVAERMPGRNTRQVRDRYQNYLSPSVINGPWSKDEDALLLDKLKEYGHCWKRVAQFFPSRTDINIKSRYCQLRRQQRKMNQVDILPTAKIPQIPVPLPAPIISVSSSKSPSTTPLPIFQPKESPKANEPESTPLPFGLAKEQDPTDVWESLLMNEDNMFEAWM